MFSHGLYSSLCSPTEFTEYTEPSCCIFSHGIHGIHRTFLLYILPRNARNAQNLLAVYSPTDCTDLHRTFLLYVLPRNSRNTQNLLAVCSPTDCTDFHRCCFQGGALVSSAPTRSVGALLALLVHLRQVHPLERTYLCRSVKSVGEYFQQPLP